MKKLSAETANTTNDRVSTFIETGENPTMAKTVTLAADDVQPETALSADTASEETESPEDVEDAKAGIWRNRRTATPEHWDMYAKDANGDLAVFLNVMIANPERLKMALKKVRLSEAIYNSLPDEAKALILKNGSTVKVAPTMISTLPTIGLRFTANGGWDNAEIVGTKRFDLVRDLVSSFEAVMLHHEEAPNVKVETALQACGFLKIRPNEETGKDGKPVGGFTLTYVKGDASQKARIIRELANGILETTVSEETSADGQN